MPIEWLALLFSVLVSAPVMEELTLRGLIQPWLAKRPWSSVIAVALALFLAFDSRLPGLKEALEQGEWTRILLQLQPVWFVFLMALGFVGVQLWSPTPVGPAIYATALLFAALHSTVWPSPIALFVLGLGLGSLTQRTQSLVGPIVLHSLFNAVGCLEFLIH